MSKDLYEIIDENLKLGRPPTYPKPSLLWKKAIEYFKWKKTQTFPKEVISGRDAEHRIIKMPTPMTIGEFCAFCGITDYTLNEMERQEYKYTETKEGEVTFPLVIAHIKKRIRQQKIDGASAGVFQHNIIAMEMGLKQIKDIQSDGKPITGQTLSVKFEDMSGDDE